MSRITARDTTMPAPDDMPCKARKNTSAPMFCDMAQPAEASVNSARLGNECFRAAMLQPLIRVCGANGSASVRIPALEEPADFFVKTYLR